MGAYLGDFAEDATVYIWFNTVSTTGAPITLAGTLTDDVKVYKNGSADEHTTYYTPTVDFDSRTGLHYVAIDMSAHAFYATASDYIAVLVDGTADSVSVAGTVLARWSCENRNIKANVTQIGGSNVTAASGIPEVKVQSIASNAITAASIATDAGTEISNAVWDRADSGFTASTVGAMLNGIDINAIQLLSDVAGVPDAVWDEARSGHVTPGTFGEGVLVEGVNADAIDANSFQAGVISSDADIATAVWAKDSSSPSLNSYGQLVAITINDNVSSILTDTGTDGVVVAASSIDAIWDEPTSGHTTAGTFGEQLKTDVDAILADTNELQTDWVNGGRLDLIADAILADTNELQTDWVNGGRLDLILDTAASGGSAPTASQIADAVWDEATSGHTSSGTFGEQLKTDVDAILADTNELQTDWTNGGRLDLILDTAATGVTVSTAQVSNERTWYGDDYRARNIVTVGNGFAGVLAVMPDLNPETAIASVSACTISGPTTVSTSNLSVRADRMAAHFTVPALTTSGTYTVTCTVLTADSQTIPTTCTLKVV